MAVSLVDVKRILEEAAQALEGSEINKHLAWKLEYYAERVPEEFTFVLSEVEHKDFHTNHLVLTSTSVDQVRSALLDAEKGAEYLDRRGIVRLDREEIVKWGTVKWIPSEKDEVWNSQCCIQAIFQNDPEPLEELPPLDPLDEADQ